jgi:hypothetical protein
MQSPVVRGRCKESSSWRLHLSTQCSAWQRMSYGLRAGRWRLQSNSRPPHSFAAPPSSSRPTTNAACNAMAHRGASRSGNHENSLLYPHGTFPSLRRIGARVLVASGSECETACPWQSVRASQQTQRSATLHSLQG